MRLPHVEIDPALPPHRLAPWLGNEDLCALDAGRASGWGSGLYASRRRSLQGIRTGFSPELPTSLSRLTVRPDRIFRGGREALQEALDWLRPGRERPERAASLTGYLAYELGDDYEPLLRRPSRRARESGETPPRVWLAGSRAAYYFCPRRDAGWVEGEDAQRVRELADLVRAATAAARSRCEIRCAEREPLCHTDSRWTRDTSLDRAPCIDCPAEAIDARVGVGAEARAETDARYARDVRRILEWIRAGDVYQVNLSRQIHAPGMPRDAARRSYARLQATHPAPFGALLETGGRQILSNSPERFLRVLGERVETRPIKGTRPRGSTPHEDRREMRSLRGSSKDLAEHMMIVDLERNDLGRVCRTGSITVPCLAQLTSFSTVHHLESSVQGTLVDSRDIDRLLAATFPGGSITGAPKIRAREIIAELEPEPRGVYTGAIVSVDARGDLDASIAIRTAIVDETGCHLHVGGGIVADSSPSEEFTETCHKARAFASLL